MYAVKCIFSLNINSDDGFRKRFKQKEKSTVGSKHQEPESAGGNEVPNMLDTVLEKKNPIILDRLKKSLHVIYFLRDCNIDDLQNQIHNSSPPFPTLKYLII